MPLRKPTPEGVLELFRDEHELRQLGNDIRAAIPSESQAEFVGPRLTHADRPEGLEILCHTHGIVRDI